MPGLRGSYGVFRDHDGWVRVRYPDGREIDMTKANYVASNRSPSFEALPLAPSADLPSRRRSKMTPSPDKPSL